MVINSQHNSTDVASSLVAGVMGTLLALDLAIVLALAQRERKPIYLRLVVGRVQRSRKE